MELTNKREYYSVNEVSTTIKLAGELVVTEATIINGFTGNFSTLEGTPVGGFNYREHSGSIDKNVYSVPKEVQVEASALLDATIDAIKLELGL